MKLSLPDKKMTEIENLGILDELQSIVCDKLQVVSYKWLSRNFLVSSNAAKRLLQVFVNNYGDGLEVIYSLSGWLKNSPSAYHIRLVSKDKLSDAKQEFEGNCSIQLYSVQACLPKDPATLWNHEFLQAEDLFKQSVAVDNCLRDNRFCGISNSFVKRSSGGSAFAMGTLQVKTAGGSLGSTSSTKPLLPPDSAKTDSLVKVDRGQGGQLASDKEKGPQLTRNNRKVKPDKSSSGSGGASARMWGGVSAKPKPEVPLLQATNSKQNSAASAEAQIYARESVEHGSSDDEGHNFNVKRTSNGESNRKRRVVFDYSDEEDEYQGVVNLASPDPPKKSVQCFKDGLGAFGLEGKLSFNDEEHKPMTKEAKADGEKTNQHSLEKKTELPTSDKNLNHAPKTESCVKDQVSNVAPKRKKVLKTRIDDRGREVTEVVWEGEEPDRKSDDNLAKVAEKNTANNDSTRPPVVKKSPTVTTTASNQTGKAGNKKGLHKDPKQGNIMSFFKKV